MVSCGNSSFLIYADNLKDNEKDFWNYLRINNFEPIDKSPNYWGYILVNVDSMLFTTRPNIISSYMGNLPDTALDIEEFKVIWDIISKHKDTFWNNL